jgi:hypothetical protein
METPLLVVLTCVGCGDLMVVLKKHTMEPTDGEQMAMCRALKTIADNEFGKENWKISKFQKTIKDHIHFHAVPIK